MKGAAGRTTMLSTPAPGPTYVSTGMSAGAGGVPDPDVTSTLLVPVNRGCVPASAMIETLSVSGDESSATWISRSMPDERSEEHTSELQSLRHLVCRLLLEKKKNDGSNDTIPE